jgi:hypothetical protein
MENGVKEFKENLLVCVHVINKFTFIGQNSSILKNASKRVTIIQAILTGLGIIFHWVLLLCQSFVSQAIWYFKNATNAIYIFKISVLIAN